MHETTSSGEGRQDEDSRRVVILARDELLGDEVHAVTQRRDESDVGVTVERGKIILGT